MQDRDLVAAIVAGEQAGLAAVYDRYAPALHAYCRVLLSEPADAADAVQDTFVVAADKLGGLRDPDRLRPWLYAVARNECLRRQRPRAPSAPLADVGELAAGRSGLGGDVELAELRAMVADALAGLSRGDREVVELNLLHGLEGDALAGALGVSRNRAHALASRARTQFERSVGALLVARTGQYSCWKLAAILDGWDGWDGHLNVKLRKRLNRHIDRCLVCGERRDHELSPAMLLSLLPEVLLPAGLAGQVLHLLSDASPAAFRYRARVLRRAGPFGRSGFPRAAGPPRGGRRAKDQALAGTGMIVFLAALGVGTAFVLAALNHHPTPPVSALAIEPRPTLQSSPSDPPPTSKAASSRQTSTTPTAPPTPSVSPSASPSASRPVSPSPSPSASPSASPSPSGSPSPSTTPPGTAMPAPATVVLAQGAGGAYTGTFTITAENGPVDFTVSDPAPAGDLGISPSDGSLTDGEQVTVTVTVLSAVGLAFDTPLSVDPGGMTVDVQYPPAGGTGGPAGPPPQARAAAPRLW